MPSGSFPGTRDSRHDTTMGKTYEGITPELAQWISGQRVFFVATAPLAASGSPSPVAAPAAGAGRSAVPASVAAALEAAGDAASRREK